VVQIYNDYKDHADFLTVYVREAHPTDEWQMKSNVKEDVCYAQPKTLEQRISIANDFVKRFHYPLPFGIDDMSNDANDAYAAWPERLYIIDEDGRIAYRGGMGPFDYKPEEVRAWLAARYGEVKHPETKAQAKDADSRKS
jgi:type I thyroxine 5'-deiodinase